MGDQEEDQCMDLAAAGADNPETTAPMAARSRCRVRRGHEAALAPQSEQVWVGLSLTPQSVTADSPAFAMGRGQLPPLGLPHEGVERALEQLAERKAVRGGDRRELLLHAC